MQDAHCSNTHPAFFMKIHVAKQITPSQTNSQTSIVPMKQERIPQLEQAAKAYEQMFLNEMVKAMRQATPKADENSMAANIYEDQLYDKYVEQWADQGGVGLSNLIYDQMMERFGSMIRQQQRSKGPIHPDGKEKVNVKKINESTGAMLFKLIPTAEQKDPIGITLPWDGKVVSSQRMDNSQNVVQVEHDNGLRSTLLFQGAAIAYNPSQGLAAGERLGIAAPGVNEILWKIGKT